MITLKNESEKNNNAKKILGFDPVRCECKTITICNLQSGGKTLLNLQRLMKGVSYDLISLKLQQLEDIGLIFKQVNYSYPAEIKYFLTVKGWECARSLHQYVDVDSIAV